MTKTKTKKRYYIIFRAWITTKNGKRLWAKDFGRRAWAIKVELP